MKLLLNPCIGFFEMQLEEVLILRSKQMIESWMHLPKRIPILTPRKEWRTPWNIWKLNWKMSLILSILIWGVCISGFWNWKKTPSSNPTPHQISSWGESMKADSHGPQPDPKWLWKLPYSSKSFQEDHTIGLISGHSPGHGDVDYFKSISTLERSWIGARPCTFGIHAETTPSTPNPCLSWNGRIDFDGRCWPKRSGSSIAEASCFWMTEHHFSISDHYFSFLFRDQKKIGISSSCISIKELKILLFCNSSLHSIHYLSYWCLKIKYD